MGWLGALVFDSFVVASLVVGLRLLALMSLLGLAAAVGIGLVFFPIRRAGRARSEAPPSAVGAP